MRALQPPFVRLMDREGPVKYAPLFAVLRICLGLALLAIFLTPFVWLLSYVFSEEFRKGGVDGIITENSHILAILLFFYTGSVLTNRVKHNFATLVRLTCLWAVLALIPLLDHHTLSWMRSAMLILIAVLSARAFVRERQMSEA